MLAGSWRYNQNTSKLKSLDPCEKLCSADYYWWSGLRRRRDVSELAPVLVGGPESIEKALRSRHLKMSEDAMRAMHQQFTATLEGLARQSVELQNELAQSRQQAANELAALRQEVRGAPLRGTQATGVGVDTRLLGKPSDFSGTQDAWRDWSTVFKGYAGAVIPRLQKLMDNAAKATEPTPNATIIDDDDRDLQGCSSQYRVPGRRQRRSRSLATTDGEVRAEDENSVRRATDVHPVLLIPR